MRNVLIVGASSGIGKACVDLFKENKWNIHVTYFSNKVHNKKEKNVSWSFLDINDEPLLNNFIKTLPNLDALVMCAGINLEVTLNSFNLEKTKNIFNTNIISQMNALALLRKKLNTGSSAIFFGSITGSKGSKRRIAYSASKASMYGFINSAAAELAPNIRVNAVFPGYVETEQYIKNSTISKKSREQSVLLHRLGRPEEVANLVLFLASEKSSYINAQCINIDGGIL